MKGALHSDALLAEVVKKDGGLRGRRRISHVFALDVPTLDEILFISDAAINIAPDLMTKVDIVQNAVDVEAARTKGIASLVAGRANVLIVPNIEAGNMLAKELTFVARAEAAGLVVGAKAPVMLTSRADNDRARLGSCALALLYEYYLRTGAAFGALGANVAETSH